MSLSGNNQVFQGTDESEDLELWGSNSTVYGNGGNDTMSSYGLSWYTDNVLFGGSGDDHISMPLTGKMYGDSGNDTLVVGGNDIFADGGIGDDNIIIKPATGVFVTGGKGSDTFTIQSQNGKVEATVMDMTSSDSIYIDSSAKKFTYRIEDGSMILSDADNTFELTFDDVSKASTLADVQVKYYMGNKTSTLGKLLGISSSGGGGDTLPTGLTYNSDKTEITASKKFKGSTINLTKYSKVKSLDASAVTKKLKITGNSLDNEIQGGTKNDSISGGAGNDTLIGGAGNDTLTGGKGNDIFVHMKGKDVITDYTAGADVIKLQDSTIESWKISGNNVVFTTTTGQITVKNGKGKDITITETKNYSSSSGLFAEDNFSTADNLSEIVAEKSVGEVEFTKPEKNSQENLITFSDK